MAPTGNCVILYSEPNFTGCATEYCEGSSDADIGSFKSIYVPQGFTVTFYSEPNEQGQKFEFK